MATRFLKDIELTDLEREAAIYLCQVFHTNTQELTRQFLLRVKRYNYVTPTAYLGLISMFKALLTKKRKWVIPLLLYDSHLCLGVFLLRNNIITNQWAAIGREEVFNRLRSASHSGYVSSSTARSVGSPPAEAGCRCRSCSRNYGQSRKRERRSCSDWSRCLGGPGGCCGAGMNFLVRIVYLLF